MAKRVSAETITEITSSPGFVPPGKVPTPPSAEDLIEATRKDIAARVEKFNRLLSGPLSNEDTLRARESLAKAKADKENFETAIKEVPEGFKLVPVLYSKITQEQNGAIHNEYLSNVRSRFLKFIGENHADAARKLGICEHGIDRMKQGLDPADSEGRPYEMNIDHIIERAGSGLWAQSKEKDPDQAPEVEDKFRQNHFGNLILIPEKIHNYKNMLNNLQRIGQLQPGESKWVLMMVPERNEQNPGFICPPQTPGSRWDILSVRPKDPSRDTHHADFIVKQTNDRIREFRAIPLAERTMQVIETIAQAYGRPAVEMPDESVKGRRSLSQIFNDIIAHDDKAREIEKLMRPMLKEAAFSINKAFDTAIDHLGDPERGQKLLANFAGFFRSGAMKTLRDQVSKMPLAEAAEVHKLCKTIERDLDMLMPPKPRDLQTSADIIYLPEGAALRKDFNKKGRKGKDPAANSPHYHGNGGGNKKRHKHGGGGRARNWR